MDKHLIAQLAGYFLIVNLFDLWALFDTAGRSTHPSSTMTRMTSWTRSLLDTCSCDYHPAHQILPWCVVLVLKGWNPWPCFQHRHCDDCIFARRICHIFSIVLCHSNIFPNIWFGEIFPPHSQRWVGALCMSIGAACDCIWFCSPCTIISPCSNQIMVTMAKAVAKKNLVHVRTPTSKQIELGTGDLVSPSFSA